MDKSTLVRVHGEVTAVFSWCTKVVHQDGVCTPNSQFLKYHYFSKIRGIKPKIDKLTHSSQLYPSLESKKVVAAIYRGFVITWPLSENHLYIPDILQCIQWTNLLHLSESLRCFRSFEVFRHSRRQIATARRNPNPNPNSSPPKKEQNTAKLDL